jgi:acid phosphatase
MPSRLRSSCCVGFLLIAGAAPPPIAAGDHLLQAVAWTQSAAEHDVACLQVFAHATAALQAAVARLPAVAGPGARPPAVVVDVDETVLDNSPYQARLVLDGKPFEAATWAAWVQEAAAPALPGAREFAAACTRLGVRIFYVTNRGTADETATRENLAAQGFPLGDADGVDVVLVRGEIDTTGTKQGRREHVASTHEVLLLVGDDLNDFVPAARTPAERDVQVRQHAARIGSTWFLVPNPMYGSWERAMAGDARGDAAVAAMRAALDPRR